jgi:hypothetical protein
MNEYTIQFENETRGIRAVMVHNLPEDQTGQVIEFPFDTSNEKATAVAILVCEIALESLNSADNLGVKYGAGYVVNDTFPKLTPPYDAPLMFRFYDQDNEEKYISLSWVLGSDDTAISIARDEACLILNLWIDVLKQQ